MGPLYYQVAGTAYATHAHMVWSSADKSWGTETSSTGNSQYCRRVGDIMSLGQGGGGWAFAFPDQSERKINEKKKGKLSVE